MSRVVIMVRFNLVELCAITLGICGISYCARYVKEKIKEND